jgi:hypothetical protein
MSLLMTMVDAPPIRDLRPARTSWLGCVGALATVGLGSAEDDADVSVEGRISRPSRLDRREPSLPELVADDGSASDADDMLLRGS